MPTIVKKQPSVESNTTSGKKIITKPVADAEETEAVETPVETKTSGWKNKLAEKRRVVAPRVLRPKAELWGKKQIKKEPKRKKGIVILLDGLGKVGKTNFELTASRFKGANGKHRDLPPGYPTYILDTENAVEDEADMNFGEELEQGKVFIENCFVENPETKEIDPIASVEKLEEWAYSLTEEQQGTLGIDNFSDYCEWTYFKLVEKILGIGHTWDGKEKGSPMPVQYKWMRKRIKSFLRRLRNMNINVILVCQVKAEWSEGEGFNSRKTGGYLTDAIEGLTYWVDVVCRYVKEVGEDGKSVVRKLIITDSRFETNDMVGREYIIEGNPTFEGLINMFRDVL